MKEALSLEEIEKLQSGFEKDRTLKIMQHACAKNALSTVVYVQDSKPGTVREFSINLKTMACTNQKSTGRCWIFAGCNLLREMAAKKMNVENFEVSQNYVAFYDKLEKINHALELQIELVDRPDDDRTLYTVNRLPVQDGGQWDMFRSLIRKYGVCPKSAMEETYGSSHTVDSRELINSRIRAFGAEIRRMYRDGRKEEIRPLKDRTLEELYNVIAVVFGVPPKTFTFEYTDKDDQYHVIKDMTPRKFYDEFIGAEMDEYVSIINAPTKDKPYHETYTVDYLGNVVGGEPIKYLNLPMDSFKAAVVSSLKAGEPVWFGSDCHMARDREEGVWDTHMFDYPTAFGFDIVMDKADALDMGESSMNHAMVLTGVNLDEDKPNRWKIENSWGTDVADKGYYVASDDWFDLYVYQAVVRKCFLSETEQKELNKEPRHLPLWDPMGTLAD